MWVIGVLDVNSPAIIQCVFDLRTDLLVGQVREKRKLSLRHAITIISHHD